MNPFATILRDFYGDDTYSGMDAAAVLVLRIMADNYKGDMPQPITCADKYVWCQSQLNKYRPNEVIDWIMHDWAQVCPYISIPGGDYREQCNRFSRLSGLQARQSPSTFRIGCSSWTRALALP